MLISNVGKALVLNTSIIPEKATRSANGVTLYTLRKKQEIERVIVDPAALGHNVKKYRKTKIPATGTQLEELDIEAQQISMI